ncbi:hypothetical protein ACFX13_044576 [Malus domestica]
MCRETKDLFLELDQTVQNPLKSQMLVLSRVADSSEYDLLHFPALPGGRRQLLLSAILWIGVGILRFSVTF